VKNGEEVEVTIDAQLTFVYREDVKEFVLFGVEVVKDTESVIPDYDLLEVDHIYIRELGSKDRLVYCFDDEATAKIDQIRAELQKTDWDPRETEEFGTPDGPKEE
jgi:hypothetical protein